MWNMGRLSQKDDLPVICFVPQGVISEICAKLVVYLLTRLLYIYLGTRGGLIYSHFA